MLRIANMPEARAVLDDALSSYPLDVVDDPSVLRLDLAERLAIKGDVVQAAELATAVLSDLPPEHRTGLFVDAGRRVLSGVRPLGRTHPAVQRLDALTASRADPPPDTARGLFPAHGLRLRSQSCRAAGGGTWGPCGSRSSCDSTIEMTGMHASATNAPWGPC